MVLLLFIYTRVIPTRQRVKVIGPRQVGFSPHIVVMRTLNIPSITLVVGAAFFFTRTIFTTGHNVAQRLPGATREASPELCSALVSWRQQPRSFFR